MPASTVTPSISVVTPVGPRHVDLVDRFLKNISESELIPAEVIIAPSAPLAYRRVRGIAGTQIRVLDVWPEAGASDNRNRGWDVAQGEFVAFCDVDDWYAPWRLSVMSSTLINLEASLGYHAYEYLRPALKIQRPMPSVPTAPPKSIRELNEGRRPDLAKARLGGNNPAFPHINGRSDAHLGHAVVRNGLDLRFPYMTHGEDGWFALQAIAHGVPVAYVAWPLSIYEPLTLSSARRAATNRMRHMVRQMWNGRSRDSR